MKRNNGIYRVIAAVLMYLIGMLLSNEKIIGKNFSSCFQQKEWGEKQKSNILL